MFKKFFKKIGKNIKKVSKGIGKGLRKFFKPKVGKIIGTVALMFIAPYLLSSAGSFFSGSLGSSVAAGGKVVAGETLAGSAVAGAGGVGAGAGTAAGTKAATIGQKMVTAFKNVGAKMKNAYNTVTEGITNFFTGGTGATVEQGTIDFASNATVSGGKLPTVGADKIAQIKPPVELGKLPVEGVGSSLEKTALETTKGRIGVVGEETASGKLITGGEIGETLKISDTSSLLDPSTLRTSTEELLKGTENLLRPSDISTQLAKDTSIQFKDRLAQAYQSVTQDPTTGAPAESFSEAYRNIKKIKPLSRFESLPKIVQGTSVGEAKYLYDVTRPVEEPYQQPQVDVGLAMSSLAEVDMTGSGANQLPSSMPLDISMAPKPMDASAWLNMVNKHGYLYSASKFGQTA